jgi:hypothetical protein
LGFVLIIFIKKELSKIDDKNIRIEQRKKADIVIIRSRSIEIIPTKSKHHKWMVCIKKENDNIEVIWTY